MITMEKFKKGYVEARTLAELSHLLKKVDMAGLKVLRDSLQIVNDYTGLDMRQEFLLNHLNSMFVGIIDE